MAQTRTPAGAPSQAVSPPLGTRIAVIDMRSVFEEYKAFKDQIDLITQEVKAFDDQVKQEQQHLLQQRDQLTKMSSDHADYHRLEASLLHQMSQAQIRSELKRKDIFEKEAQAYYDAYMQIQAAVEAFARANGIGLVVRHDTRDMDPRDRASVLAGVNRAVVHHANLDITTNVIAIVNQSRR